MDDTTLQEDLKKHLQFEEGMDDSMLFFYIKAAKEYVQNATGGQKDYLVMMVAGIMFDYRVSEKELGEALDALTPFIVQEVFNQDA